MNKAHIESASKIIPDRRPCLRLLALLGLGLLGACKPNAKSSLPTPPYGIPLDTSRANAIVEFDIQIDKLDKYDVVLEVFKKDEAESSSDWSKFLDQLINQDYDEADLEVTIESLGENRDVLARVEQSRLRGKGGSLSSTGKGRLWAKGFFLLREHQLDAGTYRIRCISRKPMPALSGRMVKVALERRHYPK